MTGAFVVITVNLVMIAANLVLSVFLIRLIATGRHLNALLEHHLSSCTTMQVTAFNNERPR